MRFRFLALLCGLVLFGCSGPRVVTLTLLTTNDIHGGIEQTSTDRDTNRPIGGAAALASLVAAERARNPDGTLLLDGGDIYQGTALSNLTDGRSTIAAMNALRYDAAAVGNHEFDWGIDTMVARMEQAEFPILAANIFDKGTQTRPDWAVPYTVVKREGVRIAIIGLATPSTPTVTMPQIVAHLDFADPALIANNLIGELVPRKADTAILLCHIGGSQRDGKISGHMLDLAAKVEGEIAVVGGHTHQRVAGVIGGTALVEAGSSMRWMGKVELTFDRKLREATSSSVEILTVFADGETDPMVAALVESARAEIAPKLEEVLGRTTTALEARRSECTMGNLIADILRETAQVDFAFQNPGGVRASIAEGDITYQDVYAVMPFDNTIVKVELTGAEVKTLLEEAVGDGSFLHAGGLRYTSDYARPKGDRIVEFTKADGAAIDLAATYSVAVNNFMAQGGDSLPTITNRPESVETGRLVRDAMIDWIRAARDVSAVIDGRSTFVNK